VPGDHQAQVTSTCGSRIGATRSRRVSMVVSAGTSTATRKWLGRSTTVSPIRLRCWWVGAGGGGVGGRAGRGTRGRGRGPAAGAAARPAAGQTGGVVPARSDRGSVRRGRVRPGRRSRPTGGRSLLRGPALSG